MNTIGHDGVDRRWFQDRLADKRLSQRKLARHLHIDPAAVSLMLRGKRKMTAAEAAEVARLLGVSVDEVVLRAGCVPTVPDTPLLRPRPAEVPPAAPPAGGDQGAEMLDLPVPLIDGATAILRLPRRLNNSDAERIAILVRAFATSD